MKDLGVLARALQRRSRGSRPDADAGARSARGLARLLEEARAVPGVEAASAVSATPLSGEGAEPIDFRIVEAASAEHASLFTANYFNAAPEHFKTLRAPLLRGRDFDASDTTSATPVAIVNETFVHKYLGSAEPVGTRVRLARTGEVTTIVGVAGDVLRDLRPGAAPAAEIYWPYTQRPRWVTMLVVRASDPAAAMSAVLQRVHGIDADIRVGTPPSDDRPRRAIVSRAS